MNQSESYLLKENLPPAIKIDDIGWQAFLQKWNDDVMFLVNKQVFYYTSNVTGNVFIDGILLNEGLRNSPAEKSMIEKIELRLQIILPASYKEFLLISNGMQSVYGRLLPANEIDWLRIRDKETMETWWGEGDEPDYFVSDKAYLDYDANGVFGAPAEAFRVEYLEHCLQIGDAFPDNEMGIWLLNPIIQTALNDWEAWVWTPSVPGVPRYRNFKEMMENSYRLDIATLRIDLLYLEEEFNQKT